MELISWVDMYKAVYELPTDERPVTEVILDDAKLDLHLANLQRKRASGK